MFPLHKKKKYFDPRFRPANSLSKNGLNMIGAFEGFSANVYICPAGKKTIGFGHVLTKNENFTNISYRFGLKLLEKDCSWCEFVIKQWVKDDLVQVKYDAIVSLIFNIGSGNFSKSTVLRKISHRDYKAAGDAFLLWNKIREDGKLVVSKGLDTRRRTERILFLTGVYPHSNIKSSSY